MASIDTHIMRGGVPISRTAKGMAAVPRISRASAQDLGTSSSLHCKASVKRRRASVKRRRASVKCPRTSVKRRRASVKRPSTSVEHPKASVKRRGASVKHHKAGVVVVINVEGWLYVLLVKGVPCYQGTGDEPRISDEMVGLQFWSLPKGGFEINDRSLHKTAMRECKEETGIILQSEWLSNSKIFSKCKYFHTYLKAKKLPSLRPQDNKEVAEARWVKLTDLPYFELNEKRKCRFVKLNKALRNYISKHDAQGCWK